MATLQTDLSGNIANEFQTFGQKLKEELNREREQFFVKYEQDEAAVLEEYGVSAIEVGGVLELLSDEQNKEAVDELVTQFIERIEQEAGTKDSLMTKGRQAEWSGV